MERYNKITCQLKDASQDIILNNLPSVLKVRLFADSLCARPPKTMDELQ